MQNRYREQIERELKDYLRSVRAHNAHSPFTRRILKNVQEFSARGGKRLRATLMIYGYLLFKPENREIIKTSICMELLQNFLLIHDDVIDKDEIRRGGPTMNKVYTDHFRSRIPQPGTLLHVGNSMAMLTGNLFYSLANSVLAEAAFPAPLKTRALRALNDMVVTVGFGEMEDLYYSFLDGVTEKDLMKMYAMKTASYSFLGPLRLGAILAGRGETEMETLKDFSLPLGQAFQVRDDILDLFGSEKAIGKPVASDLREGKKTLLIVRALATGSNSDTRAILKTLAKKRLTAKDVDTIRGVVVRTGALRFCEELSARLVRKAKLALKRLPAREEGLRYLLEFADAVERRNS
jgi:geranylgeranyl diphosphate synthase type I